MMAISVASLYYLACWPSILSRSALTAEYPTGAS